MDKKKQIEEMYTDALYNDEAPNVFADRILALFSVVGQSEQLKSFLNEFIESCEGGESHEPYLYEKAKRL